MDKRIWITNWLYSVATVWWIASCLMLGDWDEEYGVRYYINNEVIVIMIAGYILFSPLTYYLIHIIVNWVNSWFVDWFNAKVFTKYITEEVEVIKEVEVIREVPSQIVIKNMNVQDSVVMEEEE